jgi:hypothetical protein
MSRLITSFLTVVSLFLIPVDHAIARRPSIPIEVTGVIRSFDKADQTFVIETDEPAKMLTVAVGRYCKFKQNGADTGEKILRRGARVKVNYFATIFTGNIALEIELNPASRP